MLNGLISLRHIKDGTCSRSRSRLTVDVFCFSIQRFLNELEKSLNTTARKEPLNTTNYLACQRILTELVKIFDTHGYEKDSPLEQRVFFSLNGYSTLNKMIELRAECNKPPLAPER